MASKKLKKLRVIGVAWHTAHQYELAKLFKNYDLMMNYYRVWGDSSRPMPENMNLVHNVNPDDYDLAILHVDQQCSLPEMNKAKLFREFEKVTRGIPRVVINHMTPFDDNLDSREVITNIKDLVGDIPMVTNSEQAAKQWGWGTPIIHGMSVDEWPYNPKEPRAIVSLSTGGMNKAYRREMLEITQELLDDKGIRVVWIQADLKFNTFETYKDFISRALIYFNPTWQSPMPRSRTEAMLTGACIVSTRHHDWDKYIEDGVNGFIVKDNPKVAAALIKDLIENRYAETVEIGKRGRAFARSYFNHNRWAADWETFLYKEVLI